MALMVAPAELGTIPRVAELGTTPPYVLELLDAYERGDVDAALKPVAAASEAETRALRAMLMTSGRVWIDAPGHDRANRMAVAAMFALETEAIKVEKGDWAAPNDDYCAGRCVIEWACALLFERGPQGDAFEHDWFAATIALSGGQRDWAFLHTPAAVADPFGKALGHADHALTRFPNNSMFRFARAQAIAWRFEPTAEQDAPAEGKRLRLGELSPANVVINGIPVTPMGRPPSPSQQRRETQRRLLLDELNSLSTDPVVGANAHTRLAYLHWVAGEYERAWSGAEAAAAQAHDADTKYLALHVAGMAAQSAGQLSKAESLFAQALAARPYSQSASLMLAALLFQRGEATRAYELSDASLAQRKTDDDPWRMFQYGDYAAFPAKLAALRQSVKALVVK